jgi:urea transport system permease protein
MRQLQHDDEGVFGTKLQVTPARGGQWVVFLLLAACGFARPAFAQSPDAPFSALLGELREASYADKESIVDRLGLSGHSSTRPVLTAFLEDRLYFRVQDQRVFIVKSIDDELTKLDLIDPVSLAPAGSAARDDLTRIGTNNRLRRVLRTTVAKFALASPDPAVRLAAVTDMLRAPDEATLALLRERSSLETDRGVRREIETGLAMAALDGGETGARLQAIQTLSGRLGSDVRNRLAALLEKDAQGAYVEPDGQVRRAATQALMHIDGWRSFYSGIETLFFGLSLGSVLVLVASRPVFAAYVLLLFEP